MRPLLGLKKGSSRKVFLLGPFAIKIPLHNHYHEREDNLVEWELWKETKDKRLCPILGCFFGGRVLVMRRAREMRADEWTENLDWPAGDVCEENLGWFNGKLVMIDYAQELDLYD